MRDTTGVERARSRRGGALALPLVVVATLIAGGTVLLTQAVLPWWQARIAPPEVAAGSLGTLPPSTVTISVTYGASPLIAQLESEVPRRIGDLSRRLVHPSDASLRYAYQADRTPFDVRVREGTVLLSTVIEYGGRIWYRTPLGPEVTTGCGAREDGNGRLRARATFSAPVEIDGDWTLRPGVEIDRLEPLSDADRCRVGALGLELDITDAILAEAERQLRREADHVDRMLASTDLRPLMEEYWSIVREPIPLGSDAWLALNPESFHHDGIRGTGPGGRTLRTDVSIRTRPTLVLGSRPEVARAALPPLSQDEPRAAGPTLVDGLAGYGDLSDLLTRELWGEELTLARWRVEIRRVGIEPLGDGRVRVALDVEGEIAGRLEFVATPVLDPTARELTFPDLEFRVDTPSPFARAYAWLLRHGFPHRVRAQARLSLDDIPALAEILAGQASAPGIGNVTLSMALGNSAHLEGRVAQVELVGLAATPRGILVRSRVDANTTLRVREAAEE